MGTTKERFWRQETQPARPASITIFLVSHRKKIGYRAIPGKRTMLFALVNGCLASVWPRSAGQVRPGPGPFRSPPDRVPTCGSCRRHAISGETAGRVRLALAGQVGPGSDDRKIGGHGYVASGTVTKSTGTARRLAVIWLAVPVLPPLPFVVLPIGGSRSGPASPPPRCRR